MKFTVDRDQLAAALDLLQAMSKDDAAADVVGVNLAAAGERVSIDQRRRDAHAGAYCAARVTTPGAAWVSGSTLRSVVAGLPPGEATIALQDGRFGLTFTSGDVVVMIDADLNKGRAQDEPLAGAVVLADPLRDVIDATAVAMSTDSTRPNINGLHLEVSEGVVTATSTNGHRMHTASRLIDGMPNVDVVIVRWGVLACARLLEGADRVTVAMSDGRLYMGSDRGFVYSPVTGFAFPDLTHTLHLFDDVFEEPLTIHVGRDDLANAAARIIGHMNHTDMAFYCDAAADCVRIEGQSDQVLVSESLPTSMMSGNPPARVAFCVSPTYVADAIRAMRCDDVELTSLGALGALRIAPIGHEPTRCAIVMPRGNYAKLPWWGDRGARVGRVVADRHLTPGGSALHPDAVGDGELGGR